MQEHDYETLSAPDTTGVSTEGFSSKSLENVEKEEPIKSPTLDQQNFHDECKPKMKIKGFKREKNIGIICLDCGKCFRQKNTYNYHKRR